MLFNEFIVTLAPLEITYRTDIKLGADPEAVLPGRMLGKSNLLGNFTYRPKTYSELSKQERNDMRRDSRLRAFIAATRATVDGVVADDKTYAEEVENPEIPRTIESGALFADFRRTDSDRRRIEYFTLTAEEMLNTRPIYVILP